MTPLLRFWLSIGFITSCGRVLGRRQLEPATMQDSAEQVRLTYRTPDWDDFVTLSMTEIRLCGATSPQVTRRLQAMFEQLLTVVPPERKATVRKETFCGEQLTARLPTRMTASPH